MEIYTMEMPLPPPPPKKIIIELDWEEARQLCDEFGKVPLPLGYTQSTSIKSKIWNRLKAYF